MREILVTLFMVSSSLAMTIEDCNMTNDKERLACYDKLQSQKKQTTEQESLPETNAIYDNWYVSDKKTLMGDSSNVTIITNGTPLVNGATSLILRCSNNRTEVYASFSYTYMGSDGQNIRMKFDNEKPYKKWWSGSADGTALFYGGKAIAFIKKIMQHDSLVLEVSPYSKVKSQTKFNTKNLKKIIEPLRKACHW
ncbi:MAG: hypothetical protein COA92_06700 [Sulfurovum sp.]|nr:MAG: hypothetical protein COA92_06700 [Sulfurovum sp.]